MSNKVQSAMYGKAIKLVLECIENGTKPVWMKKWSCGTPVNYVRRNKYRGSNLIFLPDDCNEFLTYSQYCKLKATEKYKHIQLKKGFKKYPIIFWKPMSKFVEDDKTGEKDKVVRYVMHSYSQVIGINDIEGLETKFEINEDINPNEEAELIIENYSCEIKKEQITSKAFYRPSQDFISVPTINQYEEATEYYSTLFHEMAHSTGHWTRLGRFEKGDTNSFGDEKYSKEELIAEISASMLCSQAGIDTEASINNSVAYLKGWYDKILKDDISILFNAYQKAQKAVDYILNDGVKEFEKTA